MSEQHIPEPWQFGATPIGAKEEAISLFKQSLDAHEGSIGEYFYEIYDDEARRIAFLIGPSALANSSRILACVNACAGLPGKALKEVLPNYAAYNALHKQRDELLAALMRIETARSRGFGSDYIQECAVAALASARFKFDEVVLVEQTDELFDWCIYEATAGIFFTGVFNATREEANMLLNTIDKRKNLAYTLYKMTKSRTERKVVEEKLIVEEF